MAKVGGRKRGSRNKGFWFRKGRGWYRTEGDTAVKLCDPQGNHITDKGAEQEAEKAYHLYLAGQGTEVSKVMRMEQAGEGATAGVVRQLTLVLQLPKEQGEIIPLLAMDVDGKNLRTLR